jgi:Pyruvate/2-oxoacid:ferredoxin oxidoreductase delta subunit
LNELANKAILLDCDNNGTSEYVLPPPMVGFFEFALMRTRGDIDQKLLSELFHQYLNVEEDFIKNLFFSSETRIGRVFVQESVLSNDNAVHILDYERASHIIKSAKHIGVSMCYCRHKAQHLGTACDAPLDMCLSLNNTAYSLIKHDYATEIEASEGIDILQKAYSYNLVQCGENVRENGNFICNCCGCCCEAMVAAKKYGTLHPLVTTNFIPNVIEEQCVGCGKCEKVCPIQAISLKENDNKKKKAVINEEICLGCGVCVRNCPKKSLILKSRKERVITPVNTAHRCVLMALEKGMLQNLIFDNGSFGSHRAMLQYFQ